jgi:hypothetical protein
VNLWARTLAIVLFIPLVSWAQKEVSQFAFLEDLRKAGLLANARIDAGVVSGVEEAAKRQPQAFIEIYKSVPEEKRVSRLADYLIVKAKTAKDGNLGGDLSDFHWSYLAKDFAYRPVRLVSDSGVVLSALDTDGKTFVYGNQRPIGAGAFVVLPTTQTQEPSDVTLTLNADKARSFWTGRLDSGSIAVGFPSTSQGCEIEVKSQPSGATVMFNGRLWHKPTNKVSARSG